MNRPIIRYILGQVLKIEGVLMLLPCLVALIYREKNGYYFLMTAFLCMALGFFMTLESPKTMCFI